MKKLLFLLCLLCASCSTVTHSTLSVVPVFSSDFEEVIPAYTQANELTYVYLMGDVKAAIGSEYVALSDVSLLKNSKLPEGIYNCKVYGYNITCVAFIWNIPERTGSCGLIVDPNDNYYYECAHELYTRRDPL